MVTNFKLVILGPENSGKSALVTQFLDKRFVEDYEPTKISYARKSFGVLGQKVLLDFEEFGRDAQESFKENQELINCIFVGLYDDAPKMHFPFVFGLCRKIN